MRANDPVRILRQRHFAYCTTQEIATALGVKVETMEPWLRSLSSEGKVERVKNGWRAVYKGAPSVQEFGKST